MNWQQKTCSFFLQHCCKTSCIAMLRVLPPTFEPVLQQIRLKRVFSSFGSNPSRVSLARARSLFRPLLLSACYAGYPFYCSFSARCMYHHQDPFKWLRLFNYSGNYFGLIKPFPNIVQAENSSKI